MSDNNGHWASSVTLALAGFSAAVSVVAVVVALVVTSSTARTECLKVEAVKAYIEDSILRGEKTLPTLAYYKEHPIELGVALSELRRERGEFAPAACP